MTIENFMTPPTRLLRPFTRQEPRYLFVKLSGASGDELRALHTIERKKALYGFDVQIDPAIRFSGN